MSVQFDWKSGLRFGDLMLTGKSYVARTSRRYVETICVCEKIKWIIFDSIKSGRTTSCGCAVADRLRNAKPATTHGLTYHPIYVTYHNMKSRCYNVKDDRFYCYGARGIKVCAEWLKGVKYFYDWAIVNGWEKGLTIERDDNNKDYSPDNCKWIPSEDQPKNKTTNVKLTIWGETKYMAEWAKDSRCIVNYKSIQKRLKRGWSAEDSITIPLINNGYIPVRK